MTPKWVITAPPDLAPEAVEEVRRRLENRSLVSGEAFVLPNGWTIAKLGERQPARTDAGLHLEIDPWAHWFLGFLTGGALGAAIAGLLGLVS